MENFFRLLKQDKKSKARMGEIKTPHGVILTPAFVPVGSQATVKSLTPQDLEEIGVQVFFANTYHLYLRPGVKVVKKIGGLHQFINWDRPLMTDSGGFQVFSLGRSDLVKIDYDGVSFRSHLDGSRHYFTPEKSIEIQQDLRADMMVAFDECPPYPTTYEYAKMAMQRTHRWASRSLEAKKRKDQFLFGVIQGSTFEALRKESAEFISSQLFDGLAIGGVAVGESKKEMVQVLDWVMPVLQKQKFKRPIHLLGVGEIDDVFSAVERGVDLMDCVMPTRLGRMGWILIKEKVKGFKNDITKEEFTGDRRPLDPTCQCFVCQNFSRAYLNHLFRAKELLAYRLATYHNLYFMEQLFAKIREAIKKDKFFDFKKTWLG
jgi:queuine tRNA-ribosyltransferase